MDAPRFPARLSPSVDLDPTWKRVAFELPLDGSWLVSAPGARWIPGSMTPRFTRVCAANWGGAMSTRLANVARTAASLCAAFSLVACSGSPKAPVDDPVALEEAVIARTEALGNDQVVWLEIYQNSKVQDVPAAVATVKALLGRGCQATTLTSKAGRCRDHYSDSLTCSPAMTRAW